MSGAARANPHRGLTLVAVLVVMTGALLVVTSLLFVQQSELAALAGSTDRAQARALAWSGVQAVMVQLNAGRDAILEGRTPTLRRQHVVYETAAALGVVRLLPIGPGGELLVPEAGKLDLESADAAALAATGMVDPEVADAIVAARTARDGPFQSVAELLDVPGVTPELLYGPPDQLAAETDGVMDGYGASGGRGEPEVIRRPGDGLRGLADLVTVYAHEPALQRNGRLRISLNTPWSQRLADRVRQRFGEDATAALQRLFETGIKFDTESRLFEVLNFFNVPVEDWPDIVDTFTTDTGEFHFGRLDLNTAPYEALRGLPGVTPEQAAALVQMRGELDDDRRATIAWPAVEGVLETSQYPALAGHVTTRSWTYRLRLASGEADPDDPDGPLRHAMVCDAVIDLSSPRPRLGYWRDVSWLRTTALLAGQLGAAAADAQEGGEPRAEGEQAPPGGPDDQAPPPGEDGPAAAGSPGNEQPPAAEPVGTVDGAPPPPETPETPETPAPTAARARIGRWTTGRPAPAAPEAPDA